MFSLVWYLFVVLVFMFFEKIVNRRFRVFLKCFVWLFDGLIVCNIFRSDKPFSGFRFLFCSLPSHCFHRPMKRLKVAFGFLFGCFMYLL